MREYDLLGSFKCKRGGKIGTVGIGKMTKARTYTLFELCGVRTALQHMQVVVAFKDYRSTAVKAAEYFISDRTRVGGKSYGDMLPAVRIYFNAVSDRAGGVVLDRKRADRHIADMLFKQRRTAAYTALQSVRRAA